MLDLEQALVVLGVDDALPAVLVGVALLGQQVALLQFLVGTREVLDIDLDVMAVIGRDRLVGLVEQQILMVADVDPGDPARPVAVDCGLGAKQLAIEARDPLGGAFRHVELEIGHAEIDRAKALEVRAVHVEAVAPRAGHLDMVIVLGDGELGAGERLLDAGEAGEQRIAVGGHQGDRAAQYLGVAGRQVKLALADIDPHVREARVHIRVARQAQPLDVE